MMARLFVLGAADPEMAAIEALLTACGERVVYATVNGVRCHPGNAYKANGVHRPDLAELHDLDRPAYMTPEWAHDADDSAGWDGCQPIEGIPFVTVECGFLPSTTFAAPMQRIDHHNPGDPGWGKTPADFMASSSIGQVLGCLAHAASKSYAGSPPPASFQWLVEGSVAVTGLISRGDWGTHSYRVCVWPSDGPRPAISWEIPHGIVMVAAADHCLDAAYRGECPGVDPDELMAWRAASRAAFQKRDVADVIFDIEAAAVRLEEAIVPAGTYPQGAFCYDEDGQSWMYYSHADLRGQSIPELPEASARCGIPFLSDVTDRDGRKKCVLMGCGQHPELLASFMAGELVPGLVDCYGGDPTRGFAGGYYR